MIHYYGELLKREQMETTDYKIKGSGFKMGSNKVHLNVHKLGFIPSYMYIGMNLINPMNKPKNKNI